jgi:long-subunit acyl-CoA synthetase (AMP-forming)
VIVDTQQQQQASGLRLREKGRRWFVQITWGQVYNRAAEIAAELSTAGAARATEDESAKMKGRPNQGINRERHGP